MKSVFRGAAALSLALVLWAALLTGSALAVTPPTIHLWTGGGGDGLWSNASNWSGGVPTSGEPGGTEVYIQSGVTSTMDISGLTVDDIDLHGNDTINGSGGKTLTINGSTLHTNVTATYAGVTTTNTFASTLPISLATNAAVLVSSIGGQLVFAGPISSAAGSNGMIFEGSGTTGSTLTGANSYTGSTSISSGTLTLNNSLSNKALTTSAITVGTNGGAGTGATLLLGQPAEIADASDVTVQADGTYDQAGHGELISDLQVNGGAVKLGGGSLTLSGGLGMTDGTLSLATSASATALTVNGAVNMTGGVISGSSTNALVPKGAVIATSSATGPATIGVPLQLGGTRTFTVNTGQSAVDLLTTQPLSDGAVSPSNVVKYGAGTWSVTGSQDSTYTGNTTVTDGTFLMNTTNGHIVPGGTLTIGDGAGAASSAVVRENVQSNDIAPTTNVVAQSDGLLDIASELDTVNNISLNDAHVTLGTSGRFTVNGQLTMFGGSITGNGANGLQFKHITATSSAVGPATISAPTYLNTFNSSADITVNSGTPPELVMSGNSGPGGAPASDGVIKQGAGTLQLSGAVSQWGFLEVAAGKLALPSAHVNAPVTVDSGATLTGSGTVGTLTVNGTLIPTAPISSGAFTVAATGTLQDAVTSLTTSGIPTVNATGAVSIGSGATLALTIASGLTSPHGGFGIPLITNDGADPITGHFAAFPAGPFTVNGYNLVSTYAGGDGNDFAPTLPNAVPVIGTNPTASPNPVQAGQSTTLTAAATDGDGDALSYTWDFGDGSSGSGASVTHAYAAGTYTATVSVTDGVATVKGVRVITVTPVPQAVGPSGHPSPVVTITLAKKKQKLAASGKLSVQVRCDVACTATLSTSVKPPGKKAKKATATHTATLPAGKAQKVTVTVPKAARKAVLAALKHHAKINVTVSVTATAGSGPASAPKLVQVSLS